VPAADLTHWLTSRKTTRTRRKRTVIGTKDDSPRDPPPAKTRRGERTAPDPEPAAEQVTAQVT
jgi:hypothetical protein